MWRRLRRPNDRIIGFDRGSVKVRVSGRIATVEAEMLIGRFWRPDFVVFPAQVKWDDGAGVTGVERAAVIDTLLADAARRGFELEIVPHRDG
jgi:hypothetical protein